MDESVIQLLKILEVGLIASVKFLLAPFEAERYGFNYFESLGITLAGGITGILAFTFIGDALAYGWKKLKGFFKKQEQAPAKKFNWSTRFIVKTKMRFGLFGVALITPSIISIPVGTFLIHRFYRGRFKNLLVLFTSLVAWALALNGLAQYLQLSRYLHQPQ